MARIFISHSSRDNTFAMEIKEWLESQGFDQSFLDFDKHSGIEPGANWEKTLYREIDRSQAVLLILTPNWNESKWCFAEYTQARALGKAIFPLTFVTIDDYKTASDTQYLDLTQNKETGLQQLYEQLRQVALDAQGGFPWDKNRSPFPGLMYFTEEDAAIFFGRDDDVRRVIERLNARRAQGGARLIALLGASGSGKSSLLRAGVLPRMKRDKKNWLVLPTIRPQKKPVHQFARALAMASDQAKEWKDTYDQLMGDDYQSTLVNCVTQIRTMNNVLEPELLISLDQGEELFTIAESKEAQRFFEILSIIQKESLPFITITAMRSDFLGQLQKQSQLTERFEELSIKPMPLERIADVIRGPAEVVGLEVEESFISAATHDAQTEDALPLLAFTLRHLYERFGGDGDLTLEEYHSLGNATLGLSPLENAVRQTADNVLKDVNPTTEELKALREAFVPQLVRINDEGEYVRRPALWDDLPAKAYPLLEKLIHARLLILFLDNDKKILEVTHEALLRKWQTLQGWLNEEREFLIGKDRLEQALNDWQQTDENLKEQTLLSGLQLIRAREWLIEHPRQLRDEEREFIQVSIAHTEADQKRRERMRKMLTWGSVAASLVLAVAAFFAIEARDDARDQLVANYWMNAIDERDDKNNTLKASHYFMQIAEISSDRDGHVFENAYLAGELLNGEMKLEVITDDRSEKLTWLEFTNPCPEESLGINEKGEIQLPDSPDIIEHKRVRCAVISNDREKILSWGDDKYVRVWTIEGEELLKIKHKDNVRGAIFNKDQSKILSWSNDRTAMLWDSISGQRLSIEMLHDAIVRQALFGPDETFIATRDDKENVRVWKKREKRPLTQFYSAVEAANFFGNDAEKPDCYINEGTAYIRDPGKWKQPWPLKQIVSVLGCDYRPEYGKLITWTSEFVLQQWDIESKNILFEKLMDNYFNGAMISTSGDKILAWFSNGVVQLWDVSSNQLLKYWSHPNSIKGALLTKAEDKLLIWDEGGNLRLLDIDSAQDVFPPLKHPGVEKAIFSSDEQYFASWSSTRLKVWDIQKGHLITPVLKHGGYYIKEVKFNSSVDQIIVRMHGGEVLLWNLPTNDTQKNQDLVLTQEVLTGTRLILETGEVHVINNEEWENKKQQLSTTN